MIEAQQKNKTPSFDKAYAIPLILSLLLFICTIAIILSGFYFPYFSKKLFENFGDFSPVILLNIFLILSMIFLARSVSLMRSARYEGLKKISKPATTSLVLVLSSAFFALVIFTFDKIGLNSNLKEIIIFTLIGPIVLGALAGFFLGIYALYSIIRPKTQIKGKVIASIAIVIGLFLILAIVIPNFLKFQAKAGNLPMYKQTSIKQTKDGGYIVAGYKEPFSSLDGDCWILRLDENGDKIWDKTYGGERWDRATSAQETQDGGYIAAGWTWSLGSGGGDFLILKFDGNGNLIWDKTYGGKKRDQASCIQQTQDGGYVVTGYKQSTEEGRSDLDLWVLKLDENGNLIWDKTYGGNGRDWAYYIKQTDDLGYFVSGYTSSFEKRHQSLWILKLDENGNKVWDKIYSQFARHAGSQYIQGNDDDGYIFCGVKGDNLLILKLDEKGDLIWNKTFEISASRNLSYFIQSTEDGGYVLIGYKHEKASGISRPYLKIMKFDENGKEIWDRKFERSFVSKALLVKQTHNGNYLTAEWSRAIDDKYLFRMLELDRNGNFISQKIYGERISHQVASVKNTQDDGYIIAGHSVKVFESREKDLWISKLDENRSTIWERTYGGDGDDYASNVEQTDDGEFIVFGYTTSPDSKAKNTWIIKLDENGEKIWDQTFDVNSNFILKTKNGGFVFAWYRKISEGKNHDFWIMKTDEKGNIIWEKKHGGKKDDRVHSIKQTQDGGYIVAGKTRASGSHPACNFWIFKLDENGDLLWNKTLGGKKIGEAQFIQQTQDGGYIVAGHKHPKSLREKRYDFWIAKLDENGDLIWSRTYGGKSTDEAHYIQQTSDGGYIVIGKTSSFGARRNSFWIVKVNKKGKKVWDNVYEGSSYNRNYSIYENKAGEFVLAGYSYVFDAKKLDFWIYKLDKNGNCIGPRCN